MLCRFAEAQEKDKVATTAFFNRMLEGQVSWTVALPHATPCRAPRRAPPFPYVETHARARHIDIALRPLPAATLTGWRAAPGALSAQADIIDNQSEMKAMLEQVLSQVRPCCRALDHPR